ncbi:MAG: hypothetical protein EZS28_023751 [Streblomastix strix]|uniref:Uncharacterized protein n=1 Tax=Streblomastix strix TaxID=222440 RepID=A0A5J4VDT3_9EUKA|nr:MAG: hypothetical protein EZS28_023751 [Streblomastix strix]
MIELEQGDEDESWDDPFQGFPEKVNEPRRQQGGRSGRMNFNQQAQRPRDMTLQSPGKQIAEILSKKMAQQASTFKPLGYIDRSFIFRDLRKFRYVGSDWKVVTPKGRTRLEQGDQYADAMTRLIDSQQTLLIAMENGLSGQNKIEQIAHAYAMLRVCVNAEAQLKELANAPRELRTVYQNAPGFEENGLVAFPISTRTILVYTISDPSTVVAATLVLTVTTIPTFPAIRDIAATIPCSPVQLRKKSVIKKRIADEGSRKKSQGSFWLQFYAVRRIVSEYGDVFQEWKQ